MLRLVEPDHRSSPPTISPEDLQHLHRYIAEERHLAAMEMLLRYAIDEAGELGLPECARQLEDALASVRDRAP
jgi:hypothetical protein